MISQGRCMNYWPTRNANWMRSSRRSFATCGRKRRRCSRLTNRNGAERCSGQAHHRDSADHRSGDHESDEDGRARDDAEGGFRRNSQDCSRRRTHRKGPHHRLIAFLVTPCDSRGNSSFKIIALRCFVPFLRWRRRSFFRRAELERTLFPAQLRWTRRTWARARAGGSRKFSCRKAIVFTKAKSSPNSKRPSSGRATIWLVPKSTPPFTTPMRRRRSWNFFALTQNDSRIY